MSGYYNKDLYEILHMYLANVPESYFKPSQGSLNALLVSTKTLSTVINQPVISSQLVEISKTLAALCETALANIEPTVIPPNAFDFLKKVDFQNKYIELTKDDCNSINTFLKTSNTPEVPVEISKGKISLTDFIKTVLIPILAILAPMLLTIYHHKIDSIESQKMHIEELHLMEKELQLKEEELRIEEQKLQNDIKQTEILKKIFIEIQTFPEYLESLQVAPECSRISPELPDEAPEPFDEAQHSPDGTQDNDLSNPDVSISSEAAMQKE